MNILLIHQNFPGQFKHLGPALVAQGHRVVALTSRVKKPARWQGINVLPYQVNRGSSKDIHPWMADLETKIIRADACYSAAVALRDSTGFTPDVILAHHGWGEPMFLRDVWPTARIGLYCEFYYRPEYPYTDFDLEFPSENKTTNPLRLRLKNINNLMHQEIADAALSPTRFQADTFPPEWRDKISTIHDGVDTGLLVPDETAKLSIPDGPTLTRQDEVITFVNRNLEPYRGYHTFMRSLPKLLRKRPNARVMIVGADGVSYGAKPPKNKTWKQIFIDEVRADIPDEDWERVTFMGHMPYDKFVNLLQVSRLHIYLTYPFVLSWSLLETMSVGGAILASDTTPVRELIQDGVTGRLVDFFDVEVLVQAADALLEDADMRTRLGTAARTHIVRNYDLKTVCLPQQLEWVNRLAAKTAKPLPE
jgi:glycosyltransferase involved in cell wall biosynthesis